MELNDFNRAGLRDWFYRGGVGERTMVVAVGCTKAKRTQSRSVVVQPAEIVVNGSGSDGKRNPCFIERVEPPTIGRIAGCALGSLQLPKRNSGCAGNEASTFVDGSGCGEDQLARRIELLRRGD